MELQLKRFYFSPKATVSRLLEVLPDGTTKQLCHVLEDKYRKPPEKKVYGETCIPVGRFEVRITYSPRFKVDMPLLLNVPEYAGVRIHPGNSPRDTEGCLLPGLWSGGDSLKAGSSRPAYEMLFEKLRKAEKDKEPVFLTVIVE